MTQKELNISIQAKKVHLTKKEEFYQILNFILLLIPISSFGIVAVMNKFEDKIDYIFIIISLGLFFYILWQKLNGSKMEVYKTNLTADQFKQANQAAASLNEWQVESNKNDYFSAIKEVNWQWEGIRITTILQNGKIYLNSMIKPAVNSNPSSFGVHQKNKINLISQYQSILEGNDVIEIAKNIKEQREALFWKESEWSMSNIIKRIFGYGFCLFLIFIISVLILEGDLNSLIYAFLVLILCGLYIFFDIKVILEKMNRKNNSTIK
jgi:hypothetical protein